MRPTILVVEDRQATRDGLVQALTLQGYRAIPAENGWEALRYLRAGGPAEVIVLDLLMPVMDGWAFRRAQLSDARLARIPVIALSILAGRPLTGALPAISFEKPVHLGALLGAVGTLVRERQD